MVFEKKIGFWLTPGDLAKLAKGEQPDPYTGHVCTSDMSDHGWFLLRELTFTVQAAEFPSAETATQIAVAALQAEKQRIYAEAAEKTRKIDVQLANLQSLTYEAPAGGSDNPELQENANDFPF